jgi:hypothetical protein
MDVTMEPGLAIGRDILKDEAVEHELDAFIARRDKQRRRTGDAEEEAWMKSERRYNEQRRRERKRQRGMAGTSTRLSATAAPLKTS